MESQQRINVSLSLHLAVPNRLDRILYRKVVLAATTAKQPMNWMQISFVLKAEPWKVKRAIEFWKRRGLLKMHQGMIYPANQLN
ncbi:MULTISPECIES: hypothetical protein [unclassified Microcoleus]|uniref:hypothetical protein n=1 Tax=unclassified Microcoleus TaxID=2642155 RepID=UPI0040406F58